MPDINIASDPGRAWRHVCLIGMMGAGKTTVGREVGKRLRWQICDSDEVIVARTGFTVSDFFDEHGEVAFRREEADALARILSGPQPTVFATGGGCVETELNRELLHSHATTVWLKASVPTLLQHVGDGDGRPLLANDPVGVLDTLLARRATLYESCADVTIVVDGKSVNDVVDEVCAWVGEQPWSVDV